VQGIVIAGDGGESFEISGRDDGLRSAA